MKGVLIRPRRLRRRLVVLALALLAAGGAGGMLDGVAERVREALPPLVESARERVVPMIEEAKKRVAPLVEDAIDAAAKWGERAADSIPALAALVSGETDADDGAVEAVADASDGEGGEASAKPYAKSVALRRNADEPQKLALTFDDGPHPKETPAILDLLAKYGVKATFFVIGENAEAHPELIERELAEGHEVGNHTMTHADLSKLSDGDAASEVLEARAVIFAEGKARSRLLRPPCGAVSDGTRLLADRLGMRLVLWSVDTRDWAHTNAKTIARTVREGVKGGDVILFHDFVSGESHTLEALETLIPELIAEGYEFVTVSELFRLD